MVEAIEKNNYSELEDELGDLLLQVIYHSVIAAEKRNLISLTLLIKVFKK